MKLLLKKYRDLHIGVKAAFWFAICSIVQKGIQFVTIPFFTRILTLEQYGQFSLYQSWFSLIYIFATLNLAAGVFNNGMLKYENERSKYISSIQGLSTTVTFVVFVIYIVAIEFWNSLIGLPTIIVVMLFAELLVAPALAFWSARQRFEYKYIALIVVTLCLAITSPIISLLAVNGFEEKGYTRILSVGLVNICFGLFFYIRNLVLGKTYFNKKFWKFALLFNLPLIPHYLSSMVLGQADRIMISKMFGESQVAIYSVAYSLSLAVNIVTTSINASFVPWTYKQCKDKNYLAINNSSKRLLLFMVGASLLLVIVAPEIMSIVAPPQYYEAVWIIPPVALSVYFTFLYSLFGNIEFYFEETKFIMLASVIGASANIILNLIFMPIFGYIAAGYTTMFCYMLFSIAHYIFMRKTCKKNSVSDNIFDLKYIISITICLMIGIGLITMVYNYAFIRYSVLVALVLAFITKYSFIKQ